jgi:hypothetical protein
MVSFVDVKPEDPFLLPVPGLDALHLLSAHHPRLSVTRQEIVGPRQEPGEPYVVEVARRRHAQQKRGDGSVNGRWDLFQIGRILVPHLVSDHAGRPSSYHAYPFRQTQGSRPELIHPRQRCS